MRYTNGVKREGCLSADSHVSGWKNDLGDLLASDGFPALIEVVLEQQTVREVHHPEVLKFKGRMPLESIGRRPILQFSKGIGLVGARNCLLYTSDAADE